MAKKGLSRVVCLLSLPIILMQGVETLDHLIDTLFLARVGVMELGAIAVADAVMLLCLILPLSLADGIQVLTARRFGQRRLDAVGAAFNQGLLSALFLSGAAMVGLILLAPVVADWSVESASMADAVARYLQIDAYSIPFATTTAACAALLTSLGRTRVLIPATLILVISDVILNYLFIFGKFGFPQLGMSGAAVGSIGAELATTIFLSVYLWRTFDRRYGFFRFRKFDRTSTRQLNLISAPLAAQEFLWVIQWFSFFVMVERLGTSELAIANLVSTFYRVFWIPIEGFSEVGCSLVGRHIGRDQLHRISDVIRATIRGAMLTTLPFIALALVAPQWLLSTFAPGSDLLAQSEPSLRVLALALLIGVPAEMWYSALVGTGDTAAAFGIALVVTAVFLGSTWFTVIHLGLPLWQVCLTIPLAQLVSLAGAYGWMRSGRWKRLEV